MKAEGFKGSRADFLFGLGLAAVTGFNLVLAYQNALHGRPGWFVLVLVVGVLIPGTIPFLNLLEAIRAGRFASRWRDVVAGGIGATDAAAILAHWPEAIEDVSWVSMFILGSLLAFIILTQTG